MLLDRLLLNMLLGGGLQGTQGIPTGLPDVGTNELLAKLGGASVLSSDKFKEGLDVAIDALNNIEKAKGKGGHKIATDAKYKIKEILEG